MASSSAHGHRPRINQHERALALSNCVHDLVHVEIEQSRTTIALESALNLQARRHRVREEGRQHVHQAYVNQERMAGGRPPNPAFRNSDDLQSTADSMIDLETHMMQADVDIDADIAQLLDAHARLGDMLREVARLREEQKRGFS